MSYSHLTSMEHTKIEFFLAQGSRVCLLLAIQITATRGLSGWPTAQGLIWACPVLTDTLG